MITTSITKLANHHGVHHHPFYPIKPSMITPSHFKPSCITIARAASITLTCSLFISCGNSSSTSSGEKSIASQSIDKIAGLWPSRIPIAEVRGKDLKKMPSGADRALAWNRSLNRWVYMPVNYKPPTLPDEQTFPVGNGLLPPLHPGQDSTLQGQSRLPLE